MTFNTSLLLITGLLITFASREATHAQNQRAKHQSGQVRVSQLRLNNVIGRLGHSLGEVVTVAGVVADENYTRKKADTGQLLLRVQSVNDKPLRREVVLQFSLFEGVAIMNPAAGSRIRFIGYETGGFVGVPGKAFEYVPRTASTGFYFNTSFIVLRE
jgi:hypothetical protein